MKQHFLRKSDLILIAALLFASLFLLGINIKSSKAQESPVLVIYVGGSEYGTYPLTEDRTISIGGTNTCQIRNGQVTMIKANCPDKLCMHFSAINGTSGGSIVCLPNQVVLTIENASESDVDVIAR